MFFTDYNFFKITFTDPASPLMYGIIELHDHIFFFLNMILFLVLFLLLTTLNFFSYKKNSILNRYLLSETTKNRYDWLRLSHGTTIEIIWTIVPSLVLILIAIPSFALLYATDEIIDPAVTVQVIGHQWDWSYEYNDLALTHEPLTHEPQKSPVDEFHFLDRNYLLGRTDPVRQFYDFVIDIKHQNLSTALKSFSKSSIYEISSNLKFFKVYLPNDFVVIFPNIPYIPNHMLVDLLNGFPKVDFSGENYFNQFLVSAFDFSNENTTKGVELISGSIDFDSYMRQESDLLPGEKRLYETDFPLVLPKNTHIRFMITADDVIHSWAVPALGIKVDAVPGRINQAHTFIKRSGTFYGQCSELCGVNHAFMPIQILVFEPSMYYDYLRLMLLNK